MNNRTIGVIGITIPIFLIVGFVILFIYNPQTFEEVNNVTSIASFNIIGMKGRWIAGYFIYLAIGLLTLAFIIGLFKTSKNDLPIIIGKILILIANLIWTSFGVVSLDASSEIGIHTVMIRVISFLILAPLGLIFLGTEVSGIINDKFSKYFTLGTGLAILVIGLLSVFVFNDETWIRTNISITLYFLWFGVFGLRLVQKFKINL